MKHLLITLSILLLSSPLFSQSTKEHEEKAFEMFKKMKNEMGNEGFLEDGDENNFSSYNWECLTHNGEEHCLGKGTYPDGSTYSGEFKDGVPNGQGTKISTDGEIYIGEWKDGVKHGFGKQIRSWVSKESSTLGLKPIESNSEERGSELRKGEWKGGELFNGNSMSVMILTNEKGITREEIYEIYKKGKVDKKKFNKTTSHLNQ